MQGGDLLLLLPDERGIPAPSETFQTLLPPSVLDRLLALTLERIKPRRSSTRRISSRSIRSRTTSSFRERLFTFAIELGNTRNLINDPAPLTITHLHDPGDIPLHHDVVAFGLDTEASQGTR
ncbi:MAG: hypothetical protein RQM90_13115 [Methanoculleus sp.]